MKLSWHSVKSLHIFEREDCLCYIILQDDCLRKEGTPWLDDNSFPLAALKACLSNPPNCWIPILIIIIISACYSDHRHQRHLFKRPDEGDLSNVFGRELVGLLVCLPYYSELVGMVNLLVCWYGELVRRKSWNLRRPVNIVTAASLDSSDHSKCCQLTNRVINSSGTHRCFLYNGIVSEPMKGCRWQQLWGGET